MAGTVFQGEKLRLGRLFNSLSPADLAERVGVTRQYIHSIEISDRSPSDELVAALSFVLHVTPAYFGTPQKTQIEEEHCHFRRLKSTPSFARQECVARSVFFDQVVEQLDREMRLPEVNIENIEAKSNHEIEVVANASREHWRLGEGPISNMCRVLERKAGAVITYFPGLSEKVDAFSVSRPRPIVVRNPEKKSAVRQRFDLAHELGHLVMHKGMETGDEFTEGQANYFAGAFLLPRKPFTIEFTRSYGLDWNALYELKKRWKVSVAAIIRRAFNLELIDPAQYRIANIQLGKTGQKKIEKYDDEIPIESPELLHLALRKVSERKGNSFSEFAESLGITPLFLRKLTGFVPHPMGAAESDVGVVELAQYRQKKQESGG